VIGDFTLFSKPTTGNTITSAISFGMSSDGKLVLSFISQRKTDTKEDITSNTVVIA
jgi:hypothetical protein